MSGYERSNLSTYHSPNLLFPFVSRGSHFASQSGPARPDQRSRAISDPVGDSYIWSGAGTVDITGASVDVLGDQVRFRVTLVPPVLDTAYVIIDLDSDRNPTTGVTWGGVSGADYSCYFSKFNSTWVFNAVDPIAGQTVGHASATVFDNGFEASVPLSVFVNSDGYMDYRVLTEIDLGGGTSTGAIDLAPGSVTELVWAQSYVVPEPSTSAMLFGIGLIGMFGYAWRRQI